MDPTPLLSEAERYLTQHDLDRAAELFTRAEQLSGGVSPHPTLGLARIALLVNRVPAAETLIERVLARHPRCPEALTLRGVVAEAQGRLDEALELHARALQADPTCALALVNQGRCFAQRGEWEHAAAALELATVHGAEGPDVQVQLGVALFRARRAPQALKVLSRAVQRAPSNLDASVTLADVLVETGSLELAAQLLENTAARFPAAAVVASKRSAVALRQKDLELARREAWRTTTLSPRDEEAWLFAAVLDTMALRFDTAERALKRVLSLNPCNWRAHYHLGGLYDATKDRARARRAYRKALEFNPGAWEPLNNLAIMLLEEGTDRALLEARSLLERAARPGHRGDAVVIHFNLALACFRLGDRDATLRVAKELVRLAPAGHPFATEAQRVMRLAA